MQPHAVNGQETSGRGATVGERAEPAHEEAVNHEQEPSPAEREVVVQRDRFEQLYDTTHKRLRHVEDRLLYYKSAHRALERVCEDLRGRLASAEEHSLRARDLDAAILAREAAESSLAETKAEIEFLRSRLSSFEAAAAVADDSSNRCAALEARVNALECEIKVRDRLLRDREAERAELRNVIRRYEKELRIRETSLQRHPLGRSRRLDGIEHIRDGYPIRRQDHALSELDEELDESNYNANPEAYHSDEEDMIATPRSPSVGRRLGAPGETQSEHGYYLDEFHAHRRRGCNAYLTPRSNNHPDFRATVRDRNSGDEPGTGHILSLINGGRQDNVSSAMDADDVMRAEIWRQTERQRDEVDRVLNIGLQDIHTSLENPK